MRYSNGITASFKMVDTCAAEFEASTPYYYSCFDGENEAIETNPPKKVLVLGSGPIRIGQGIEFDYCSVHATWAFAKAGYETIIINNNPETVSTDFDIADKLYFEPLTPEDVENVVNIEKPDGAVVQFGGQTAIKLTESLMKMGVPILGTKAEDVDAAEDRELFDERNNNDVQYAGDDVRCHQVKHVEADCRKEGTCVYNPVIFGIEPDAFLNLFDTVFQPFLYGHSMGILPHLVCGAFPEEIRDGQHGQSAHIQIHSCCVLLFYEL